MFSENIILDQCCVVAKHNDGCENFACRWTTPYHFLTTSKTTWVKFAKIKNSRFSKLIFKTNHQLRIAIFVKKDFIFVHIEKFMFRENLPSFEKLWHKFSYKISKKSFEDFCLVVDITYNIIKFHSPHYTIRCFLREHDKTNQLIWFKQSCLRAFIWENIRDLFAPCLLH